MTSSEATTQKSSTAKQSGTHHTAVSRWLLASTLVLLVSIAAWAFSFWKQHMACPWISTGSPHIELLKDGLHVEGTDRVRNFGTGPVHGGRWAYYVLIVPMNDLDADIAARIKVSDQHVAMRDLGELLPDQKKYLAFQSDDGDQLGYGSFSGHVQNPWYVNRYLRLLITYPDAKGTLHHTYRCYQVAQGVDGTIDIFGCPFGARSD